MSTEVAKRSEDGSGYATIKDRLNSDKFKAEVARVLPSHLSPERQTRVALNAITRTPKLAECDQVSFFKCLLDLSQVGLEPDGRHAHLVPRWNKNRKCYECTLIIDYKGLVALCFRSKGVRVIDAELIHEGDFYEYDLGEMKHYVPWFLRKDAARPENQGAVIGAYCLVVLVDGAIKTEVMSYEEIEKTRKCSAAGNDGPWVNHWGEMAKKTVFRRCAKWLPQSAEMVKANDIDEDKIIDAVYTRVQKSNIDVAGLLTAPQPQKAIETTAESYVNVTPEQPDEPSDPGEPNPADDAAILIQRIEAAASGSEVNSIIKEGEKIEDILGPVLMGEVREAGKKRILELQKGK